MSAKPGAAPVSALEWATAVLGAAIAAGLFGIIGWEALHHSDGAPPELVIEPGAVAATRGGYVLQVDVRNLSGRTGAGVQIEGRLRAPGGEETSAATIDYVPGRARRQAGLIFARDPRGHPVELRVTGYQRP